MKTEHILVIRFSAIGDVAMTVPVISSLAKQYPEVRITVLSRPFARVLFEQMPPNVSFMAADIKKEYHGVSGLNALYRRLAANRNTCDCGSISAATEWHTSINTAEGSDNSPRNTIRSCCNNPPLFKIMPTYLHAWVIP